MPLSNVSIWCDQVGGFDKASMRKEIQICLCLKVN